MRRLITLLMICVFAVPALPGSASAARAEEREWTILVYLCGSDLESENGAASEDIREMIASGIGKSGAVSVLIATGGAAGWQRYGISSRSVQYHRLGNDGLERMQDVGRRSMGEAGTLGDFLRWGTSAAPAKRYALILWDHGGGPVFGLCNDENFDNDSLSLAELKNGLESGLGGTGLDIIGFDCCLMNCLDLCGDLYGIADYAVLSQEMVTGTGLDYDSWMKTVAENPALPSESVAIAMAETYVADNSKGRFAETATMSVIETARMPAVMDAANAFSAALTDQMQSNLSGVIRLRNRLTSFGKLSDSEASDLVDVEDMCDAFSALLPQESAALKSAAQQAVCHNCATADIASHAHGLSFFMPCETIRSDRREILSHYSGQTGAYANLAVAMTNQVSGSGYGMAASSYTPSSFYYHDEQNTGGPSFSGSLYEIWNGYYGDYCSFDDVYASSDGNIWAGLNTDSGSAWTGFSSSSGIWDGYGSAAATPAPSAGGIWAGLPEAAPTPAPQTASAALDSIWAGLLNTGSDYYQPGEQNQNVQANISEAVSAGDVLETANTYFSSASLTAQIIYSVQLNKTDLDHLAKASGVLILRDGDELVRLGNIGQTTIDWSTGLVISMFDGSWPMLGDQMVRADFLYEDEAGNTRFVIPARVNGLKMYLLGSSTADGRMEILGATQGYDENGFAIRGTIELEAGMTIRPLFAATAPDGSEREYEGRAVTVPQQGLELTWGRIPAGSYLYCFGLTDLSGVVHYTDTVEIGF